MSGLDRLAELGRPVEKTWKAFSPGAGLPWYDAGERDVDFLNYLIESMRAALAERIASEVELADECERLERMLNLCCPWQPNSDRGRDWLADLAEREEATP